MCPASGRGRAPGTALLGGVAGESGPSPTPSQTLILRRDPEQETVRRELVWALGLTFGLTLALAVVQWAVPATASGMQVGLAIILLQVPTWVLARKAVDHDHLGLLVGPMGRALGLGFATMAVVFPLFVLGYHLVHTELLDRRADWDVAHLARWDEDLELAPARPCGRADAAASAWLQGDELWIVAPPGADLQITVRADPPVRQGRVITCELGGGPRVGAVIRPDRAGRFRPGPGHGLWAPLADRDHFEAHVEDGGRPVPADRLRIGRWSASADDDGELAATRDAWWLLTYVIVHLGLVALPEEWFFRGYLQGRLDGELGTPRRLLGADVGWGLVLSALAFALLHPILLPGMHRLLVFFPALLFGWLRAKSGNVGAAILVHAGSNVLLAVVSRMYA